MRKLTKPHSDTPPIEHRILTVRSHGVMLDSDLAQLYGVATRALLQAVRRNAARFPADFMFRLTGTEAKNLRSQSVISSWHGGRRSPPVVFTEHGVAMLSSVLRSRQAITVNIGIMRAFARQRTIIKAHTDLVARIDELEHRYEGRFKAVFAALREVMAPTQARIRPIGFEAQPAAPGLATSAAPQSSLDRSRRSARASARR